MRRFALFLPLVFYVFDRVTKQLLHTSSAPINADLFFFPFPNRLIAIVAIVFLIFLAWWMTDTYRQKKSHFFEIFFFQLLLFVSIASNTQDRFQYGGVIDWIPLFVGDANFADIGICIAVRGLLLYYGKGRDSTSQ